MKVPWPLRSALAGTAGTAAMTLAYALERQLRADRNGPLDYDDSPIPGQILASVMRVPDATLREVRSLGMMLRWGYGSALGIGHGALRRTVAEPWASAIFGATVMTGTLTLFPLLGETPPPWRWPADVLATSLRTHAAYVVAVAAMNGTLGRVPR
jgi:hypothetical protein